MSIESYLAEITKIPAKFSISGGLIRDWESKNPRSPLVHLAIIRGCDPRKPYASDISRYTKMSKIDVICVFAAEDNYPSHASLRQRIIEALGLRD